MDLDVYTILTLLIAICALISAVLVIAWRRDRETTAYVWWSAACGAGVVGLFLILLRDRVPDFLSVSIGNSLVILGMGGAWAGVRSLYHRPVRSWHVLGPLVPWVIGLCFDPVMDDPETRTMLLSAVTAITCFAIAIELWRGRSEFLPSNGPLTALVILNGAFYAVRGVVASSRSVPDTIDLQGLWFVLSLVEATLFIIAAALFAVTLIRERSERRLMTMAARDPLTQALNRRGFFGSAEIMLGAIRDDGRPVALLLFDLDSFKLVNDHYGHPAGDMVLESFVTLVNEALPTGGLLCRLGGEEFAALLPDMQSAAAMDLGERIRREIDGRRFNHDNSSIHITVSVGIAVLVGVAADLQRLLTIADHALYEAKAAGRNQVKFSAAIVG